MRHLAVLTPGLVLVLASAACGGHVDVAFSGGTSSGSGGEVVVFCDIPYNANGIGRHECDEFVEPTQDAAGLASQSCTEYDMGTIVGACPTAGLLGTCTRPSGGPAMPYEQLPRTTFYYSDGGGNLQGAELLCAASVHGTWSSN